MLLRRFYEPKLAQASYLIGCQATGEAIVIDPIRDSDIYLGAAADEKMTVRYVTETHIHADYLSGARQLARRAGAELLLSAEGGPDWQYAFAHDDGARLVRDGDVIRLGRVSLEVLHTPGHTPEHISFAVTDGAATDEPLGLLTGDFLFVGDVGRPDLLEKAAGVADTMEAGARDLFRSIERVRPMPDYLQILPGHGAGSACGKALGAVPTSTLGYEKLVSWAFQCATEDEFVGKVLEDQPEPPVYFAVMKRLNRDGPPLLERLPRPDRGDEGQLRALADEGALIVDLRHRTAFAAGHVPGSLNVPWASDFTTWAGWLLPYDRPVHFVADDPGQAEGAARDLALIGIDRSELWFGPEALARWQGDVGPLERAAVIDWDEAERAVRDEDAMLLDVRARTEWNEGHVPDAVHVHLGALPGRIDELRADRPLLVYCRTGNRSAVAASLLQRAGFPDVRNIEGGIVARERPVQVARP